MNILIIGKGGREHALAWKIKQSPLVENVFIAPGNVGMKSLGQCVPIAETDGIALAEFALKNNIALTIAGPESSLAIGVGDIFAEKGLKFFGPSQKAAQIESSKDFAKKIMHKYNIPTAEYKTFSELSLALEYVQTKGVPIVIKEDGLRAGKGVTVAMTTDEALAAVKLAFSVPNTVVIEDYLDGFEFSIIALVAGDIVIPLEVAQDHKRVGDGDTGPNTGGMGVYSPVGKITPKIVKQTTEFILEPMAKALVMENIPFTGFLFGGIMLTQNGVKTIEFNARFGDPEAEGILPRLKSDLIDVIFRLLEGKTSQLIWDNRFSTVVVMASHGYPEASTNDAEIIIPQGLDSLIFHMGTKEVDGKLLSAGGRVLAVTSLGATLQEARDKAYVDVKKIKSNKLFYRSDIGAKMLDNKEDDCHLLT